MTRPTHATPISSTRSLSAAAGHWPAVVVGAGPAGSLAALHLARRGVRVLLVEKAQLPRYKVCGCCLNSTSLTRLSESGLGDLPTDLGAVSIERVRLVSSGREVVLPLAGGVSLSRSALDVALAAAAVDAGAELLVGATARLGPLDQAGRTLTIRQGPERIDVRAGVVLAADGLGGRTLTHTEDVQQQISPRSRVGVGVVISHEAEGYEPNVIHMACGRGGYVGLVRVERGQLAIAAALRPALVRRADGAGAAAVELLGQCGLAVPPAASQASWRAVPQLTRRVSSPAAQRVLAVGDAAGYVEPFTGEGMAWAMSSALSVAPLAAEAAERWRPELAEQWRRLHAEVVRRRQWVCRGLSMGLRSPLLTRSAIGVLTRAPGLARPVLRRLGRG